MSRLEHFLSWLFRHEDILGLDGSLYLRRWRVLGFHAWLPSIFGLNLMIHRIVRPDEDREPHDHPWWFLSFLVRGRYVEERTVTLPANASTGKYVRLGAAEFLRWPGSFAHRTATEFHRIASLVDGEAWTIVLTGSRLHTWGFLAEDGTKIPHDEYFTRKFPHAAEVRS